MRLSFLFPAKSGALLVIDWRDEDYHETRDRIVERLSIGQLTGEEVRDIHMRMFVASVKADYKWIFKHGMPEEKK